jgi:hypothetical protein
MCAVCACVSKQIATDGTHMRVCVPRPVAPRVYFTGVEDSDGVAMACRDLHNSTLLQTRHV